MENNTNTAQIQSSNQPTGELLMRTVAMPENTNPHHYIFGGWIMSQLDMGGGILATEIAQGRVVTVSAQQINFILPIQIGHVVCCYGQCIQVGNTSLQIKLEIWVDNFIKNQPKQHRVMAAEAVFVYVSVDENGVPRPIIKDNNPKLSHLS